MHVRVDNSGTEYIAIACSIEHLVRYSLVDVCAGPKTRQSLTAIQQTSNTILMEFALETTILILGGDNDVPNKRETCIRIQTIWHLCTHAICTHRSNWKTQQMNSHSIEQQMPAKGRTSAHHEIIICSLKQYINALSGMSVRKTPSCIGISSAICAWAGRIEVVRIRKSMKKRTTKKIKCERGERKRRIKFSNSRTLDAWFGRYKTIKTIETENSICSHSIQ